MEVPEIRRRRRVLVPIHLGTALVCRFPRIVMLVQIRIGQFGFVQQCECRMSKVGFGQVLLVSFMPVFGET